MSEEIDNRQLAEVLLYLAQRIRDGLEEGADIIAQLKQVAAKLEERNAR